MEETFEVKSKIDTLLSFDVLKFCNWKDRINVLSLKKNNFLADDSNWAFFCDLLRNQHYIYYYPKLSKGYTWKRVFFEEMWPLKSIWKSSNNDEIHDNENESTQLDDYENCKIIKDSAQIINNNNKIMVYARFKPVSESENEDAENDENNPPHSSQKSREIVLPLHQRLALIRQAHGLKSNKEALKILMQEGSWFGKKWDGIRASQNKSPRKIQTKTSEEMLKASVQHLDTDNGKCVLLDGSVGLREFLFDGVLSADSQQDLVYATSAQDCVRKMLNGFNAAIIAYGQTGSGKTYTLFGPDSTFESKSLKSFQGVVPRACNEILLALNARATGAMEHTLRVSYVEIYGDTITDLLKNGARCGHSKVAAQRFVLNGAAEEDVFTMNDVEKVLRIGDSQKKRAATAMNDRSSRAHAIFILHLNQKCIKTGTEASSKLFMADLGGCEKVSKSGVATKNGSLAIRDGTEASDAEPQYSTGFKKNERLREAVNINLGLLALKKCVEAINSRALYIPYQDSKLTTLLSTGLGGDSVTSVIVCGSMASQNASETMAAMRFGEQCSLVQTSAVNKANMLASVLQKLNQQIANLENEIKLKERWEMVEEKRTDALAEAGTFEAAIGGVEVKKVSVLIGAEKERLQLESLLRRRSKLTGSERDKIDDDDNYNDKERGDKEALLGKENSKNKSSNSRVNAFGGKYAAQLGFGAAYDVSSEQELNARFSNKTDASAIPIVIKSRGKEWKGMDELLKVDPKELEKKAKTVKRNKLVYAGMSA